MALTIKSSGRIKRSNDVRSRVSEDIQARLEKIAQIYGVPPGTLASLAIGSWVAQQERTLRMVDSMSDAVGQQLGDVLANELRDQLSLLTKDSK